MPDKWTYLLLFGSGFSALTYQMVWMREFRLVFGASTASTAAVSAVFMAGLGLGGWLLGPRADREPKPLLFYAKLELIISLFAALSPFLLHLVREAYLLTGGAMVMGTLGATIARLLIAAIVLGLPTVLMGGTLPAAVRAVTAETDGSRRSLGLLYGVNTLGALAGVMLTTFFLLEMFGARYSLYFAVAVNLMVVLAARKIGEAMPELANASLEEDAVAISETAATGSGVSPKLALATAAGVGFVFFLMELVWYRMLAPILGGSTYTFGLILAVALAGIGVGGAIYPLIMGKRRPTAAFLAVTCLLEALAMMIPYAIGDWIAAFAVQLQPLAALGFYGIVGVWFVVALVVVFPASLISGVQFPLLIALLGQGAKNIGKQTGRAYACNTMGSIAGSLAGGFGLMPWLTAPGCWLVCGLLLAVFGLAILLSSMFTRNTEGKAGKVFVPAGALTLTAMLVLCCVARGPTAAWRHSPIGAGRTPAANTSERIRAWMQERRSMTIWEADGVESSVGIQVDSGYAFLINGKSDGNVLGDKGTQIMVGMVAAALHPAPRKAMVVGLGTGCTAGWLASIDGMEQVDVVELEPAVLHMARLCSMANLDVVGKAERGEGVRIIINDAREVLTTIPEKYDIIASEPSNPYRAGIASLFTKEFYEQVRNRLNQGGLFVSWCQAYEINTETVFTILATLREVFPHVECWYTQNADLAFIASMEPIRPDPEALARRLSMPAFKDAIRIGWGMEGLEGFAAHFIAGDRFVDAMLENHVFGINTDDLMRVEYDYACSVGRRTGFSIRDLQLESIKRETDLPEWLPDTADKKRLLLLRSLNAPFEGMPTSWGSFYPDDIRERLISVEMWRLGKLAEAAARPFPAGAPNIHPLEYLARAECLAEIGDDEALSLIVHFETWWPASAPLVRARLAYAKNEFHTATKEMLSAFTILKTSTWLPKPILDKMEPMAMGIADKVPEASYMLYFAVKEPFALYSIEKNRKALLLNFSTRLGMEAVAATLTRWFEPNPPWNAELLELRAKAYINTNNPLADNAIRDFEAIKAEEQYTVEQLMPMNEPAP